MVKYLLSIDGVDNSGKSTSIKSLVNYFDDESLGDIATTLDLDVHKLSEAYPSDPRKVRDFFVNSPIELVVKTLLEINKRKSEIVRNSPKKYGLLDRGFVTTLASCIARIQTRKDVSFSEALELVDKINQEVGYSPLEKDAIILSLDLVRAIDIYQQREGEPPEQIYATYLNAFIHAFQTICSLCNILGGKQIKRHFIDAGGTQPNVQKEVIRVVQRVTDIRYELLLNELVSSKKFYDLESIIVGGSYALSDIVPNWSDLDVVCILREKSKINNLMAFCKNLSVKYDVRFNPGILSVEELQNPAALPLKSLLFLLPEYPSRAICGEKRDLRLSINNFRDDNKRAFVSLLSFYDALFEGLNLGTITDETFILRGTRVCFNLMKMALFDKGIVIASHDDVLRYAKSEKLGDYEKLKILSGVRREWNYAPVDFELCINQIKSFVAGFRGVFQNG